MVNRVSRHRHAARRHRRSFPATLAPGASCTVRCTDACRAAGDPDPLPNTVTAIYGTAAEHGHGDGSASTNLFQPSITLNKTGDTTTSKAGDQVNYTITVNNTSSADSPNCVGNVVDPLLGINQAINLAPGASTTINASRTVLAGDPDPLVNTATATCSPVGFPNVLTASDSHEVDLVHPNYTLTKECAPSLSERRRSDHLHVRGHQHGRRGAEQGQRQRHVAREHHRRLPGESGSRCVCNGHSDPQHPGERS